MESLQSPGSAPTTPLVRLNSKTSNILHSSDSGSDSRPGSAAGQNTRSLLSPRSQPGTPGAAPTPRLPPPVPAHSSLYRNYSPSVGSTELLLPPPNASSRTRRYRDGAESPSYSPSPSRRSSIGSAGSRDSRHGPFTTPFDDSRSPSRAGSDEEGSFNTQTISEKYNIQPSAGLLLFPEDVEKDDWLHTPDPNEDRDRKDCDIFTKRGAMNLGGLILIAGGILMLFIGYPVLTFVHRIVDPGGVKCSDDPNCISDNGPLLQNIRQGLIDPDTPDSAKTRKKSDGGTQVLTFSDEFNRDGRTFYDGDDPYFQGVDIWYGATQDLEKYDPDAITTQGGTLNIEFDKFTSPGLDYRSGMLQSWNKLCFKGGTLVASVSLPGSGATSGFWPGFWSMGNLGRPGYLATTEGMWPYSYHDSCDVGITANQSQVDGTSFLPGMKLPACTCDGQDHPSQGKSRSAPELDVLEASVDSAFAGGPIGYVSQSLQVAPFDLFYQPNYDFAEMYDYSVTSINPYQGGPFQQAMSAITLLNNDWYDGKAYQEYAYEYTPGSDGYVKWYVGDEPTWMIDARSMGPNGNIGQRTMPEEPMTIIANLGMSPSFAPIEVAKILAMLPATMRFDYIRIYQDEGSESMTCDPPDYPTTDYIRQHPEPYYNQNITQWEQTKYGWPTNDFVHGC